MGKYNLTKFKQYTKSGNFVIYCGHFSQKKRCFSRAGFTLLEMVIALGIFSILVVLAIGVMISVSRAQVNASTNQALLDNVRFSLELMTKELRTGTNYTLPAAPLCGGTSGSEIHFTATSGNRIYYLQGTTIMRAVAEATDFNQCYGRPLNIFTPFTAPEIAVESLAFQAKGNNVGPDDGQPTITVSIQTSLTNLKTGQKTRLNIQTTVVQRQRDL